MWTEEHPCWGMGAVLPDVASSQIGAVHKQRHLPRGEGVKGIVTKCNERG
jgi:hypothetical protein